MTENLTQKLTSLNLVATQWHHQVDLGEWSYFQIATQVENLAIIASETDLIKLVDFLWTNKIEFYIFGSLSNVLFAKENFDGVVILYRQGEIKIEGQELTAGSGALMSAVAQTSIQAGLAGLAQFSSLPGTVGGAIFNNAHYAGTLIGDHLVAVKVYQPSERAVAVLSQEELELGYDQSIFHRENWLILSATWRLERVEPAELEKIALAAAQRRQSSQPLNLPGLGCFWRNPANTAALRQKYPQFADQERIPAGFLIEKAGLKGQKCGGVEVSDKHAAFLVKTGPAQARDVLKLATTIRDAVKKQDQLDLEAEVTVVE